MHAFSWLEFQELSCSGVRYLYFLIVFGEIKGSWTQGKINSPSLDYHFWVLSVPVYYSIQDFLTVQRPCSKKFLNCSQINDFIFFYILRFESVQFPVWAVSWAKKNLGKWVVFGFLFLFFFKLKLMIIMVFVNT